MEVLLSNRTPSGLYFRIEFLLEIKILFFRFGLYCDSNFSLKSRFFFEIGLLLSNRILLLNWSSSFESDCYFRVEWSEPSESSEWSSGPIRYVRRDQNTPSDPSGPDHLHALKRPGFPPQWDIAQNTTRLFGKNAAKSHASARIPVRLALERRKSSCCQRSGSVDLPLLRKRDTGSLAKGVKSPNFPEIAQFLQAMKAAL